MAPRRGAEPWKPPENALHAFWGRLGASSGGSPGLSRTLGISGNNHAGSSWTLEPDGIPDDTTGDGQIQYGHLAPGETPDDSDYLVFDIWIGDAVDLRPEETGWQDTAWVDPNQMISIVATFDKPALRRR
jgi:FtsP/CotA-like multicopper oxidase with cupredoxin domain